MTEPRPTAPPDLDVDTAALAAFLGLSPDAVVVVDTDGVIRDVNDRATELTGYDKEQLVGRPVELLVPSRVRAVHEAQRTNYTERPSRRPMGVDLVLELSRRDGVNVPVDISLAPLTVDGNTVVAAVIRDVSDRREADRELRELGELFQRAGFGIGVSAGGTDRLARVNPALAEMYGTTVEQLAGASIAELFAPEERSRLPGIIKRAAEQGQVRFEATHIRRDGTRFPVQIDVTVVRDRDGEIVCRIGYVQDISARRAAEQRLQSAFKQVQEANAALAAANQRLAETNRQVEEANAELEAVNAYQRDFVSMASHELRTPLTTIRGFVDTLHDHWDDLTDDRRRSFLAAVGRAADRQTILVSDLLDVSRIRSGRLELDPVLTDVRAVVAEALTALPDLDAQVRIPDGLSVLADEVRVVQILVNFLSNADKYGEPPIEIDARRVDDDVEITIRDHGPGVPAEFRADLFEMFQQASRGDRRTALGTGLGLYIARQLASAQNGDVFHEAPDDGGARFGVRLPAVDDEPTGR